MLSPLNESFRLSIEDSIGNDAHECAPHERPTLPRANQLLTGSGKYKFHQVAVKEWVTLLVSRVERQSSTRQLSSQRFERGHVCLKTRQRTEKPSS